MTIGLPDLPFSSAEWVFLVLMAMVLLAPVGARRLRLPGLLGLIVAGMMIGPNALGLVARDGFVATLGGAGLLFLMFMAGLELDLRNALDRFRTDTIVFGVATFTIPMAIGVIVLPLMGFEVLAAVLLASTWSTHTVLAYPIFQRYGVVNNRGVAVAIGATLITNVTGLLVLAVVIALHTGGGDITSWLVLIGGLGLLVAVTLLGIPRLTRWFLAGLGGDRLVQVLYVLAVLFAAASLASAVGIEPIVGAFFAGLGLNQHVPKRGQLGERLSFLGDSLLVPMFLISTGMLIDPRSLVSGWSLLLLGAAFIAQSQGGKLVAALAVGRWRRFHGDEVGAMFSLTAADAAATLAAVLVGFEVGLFDQSVIEAIVVVILCSCTIATITGERYAPRIGAPPPDNDAIGRNIVVPVANPRTAGRLTEVAARLAAVDSGTVHALNILAADAGTEQLREHRALLRDAEATALRVGVEAQGEVRVADSSTVGVLHEVIERDATAVVMGWKGFASAREHLFGGATDDLVGQLQVPTLLGRLRGEGEVARVVVHLDAGPDSFSLGGALALTAGTRLANSYGVPLVVVASPETHERFTGDLAVRRVERIEDPRPAVEALAALTTVDDLVIVGYGPYRGGRRPSAVAGRLPDRDLLIATGVWHADTPDRPRPSRIDGRPSSPHDHTAR